jgi:diaminopimelate epimerase
MLIQKFWKKRALLIAATVFLLTLFTININALVKGKVESNDANAWKFWIFGLHTVCTGTNPDGSTYEYCCGNGLRCIIIDLSSDNSDPISVSL